MPGKILAKVITAKAVNKSFKNVFMCFFKFKAITVPNKKHCFFGSVRYF